MNDPNRVLDCALALTPEGWVRDLRLELDPAGIITATGRAVGAGSDHRLKGPVLPGMPNLHSHAFQRLMAGLSYAASNGEDSFWTWRETMYAMAARVTPEQLEHCAAGLFAEMLKGGYTSCAEFHYLHHDVNGAPYADPAELSGRILTAARRAGVGLTLLPVLYSRAGFDATGVAPHQARFRHSVDGYLTLLEALCKRVAAQSNTRLGIAPHSLRAVGFEDLHTLLQHRSEEPVHIHIAEQQREVDECLAAHGARPVELLLDRADVDQRWCLVHATHMDEGECGAAAASGAVAGLCPTTEADLGDGIFDAVGWTRHEGGFGVGSDSNLRVSAAEELRLLEFTQRLATGRRNVLIADGQSCGRRLYEAATAGGAQALGQPVGRIETGRRADLVELDADHPWLAGLDGDALLDSYVFAHEPGMIHSVWVAGEPWVEQGAHRDEASIQAAFRRVRRELRSAA